MKQLLFLLVIFSCVLVAYHFSAESSKQATLPGPFKYLNKFETVWTAARQVLEDMGFKIESEDRANGKIVTKPYEFITGSMTVEELDKVSSYDSLATAWLKGRYTIEVVLEILQPNETSAAVNAKIEGLQQDLAGNKTWVERRSTGVVERRILGKLSMKLLSPAKEDKKKGFWNQPPQPIFRPKDAPRPIPTPARERP